MSANARPRRARRRVRGPRQTTHLGGMITGRKLRISILLITVLAVAVSSALASVPTTP